jgi:hypothetical protein
MFPADYPVGDWSPDAEVAYGASDRDRVSVLPLIFIVMDDEIAKGLWTSTDANLPRDVIQTSKPRRAITTTVTQSINTMHKATKAVSECDEMVWFFKLIPNIRWAYISTFEVITTTAFTEWSVDERFVTVYRKTKERESPNQRTRRNCWTDDVVPKHRGFYTRAKGVELSVKQVHHTLGECEEDKRFKFEGETVSHGAKFL